MIEKFPPLEAIFMKLKGHCDDLNMLKEYERTHPSDMLASDHDKMVNFEIIGIEVLCKLIKTTNIQENEIRNVLNILVGIKNPHPLIVDLNRILLEQLPK